MSGQPPSTLGAEEPTYLVALLMTAVATKFGCSDDAVATLSFDCATSPQRVSRRD